jgi:hypothetical protein
LINVQGKFFKDISKRKTSTLSNKTVRKIKGEIKNEKYRGTGNIGRRTKKLPSQKKPTQQNTGN